MNFCNEKTKEFFFLFENFVIFTRCLFFDLENKTTLSPTKVTSAEAAKLSSTEPVSESTTENPPKLTKDQLHRLKRQLALESELSSAMDESENLGIEQVSILFFRQQTFCSSS